ncbi:phosphoadenosine phosphosulfate reductase family protein [uncultured Paraglaciecola sp.]|uniref:phosphoadenosine phosphosulfate reductase domain-containing protein n=1 Tax=uncultured Paraglaciecola sp. TaxID=1765024 RepID=UPI00260B0A9C|nr:phosphoadenosine phosphosulfate reductase family protein [uncultured Paraglaciecola sp.]
MSYVISTSYGNDSMALALWAHEQGLEDVTCVYIDTGWAASSWPLRVNKCEDMLKELGINVARIHSGGMAEMVLDRKGFPSNQHQFCTAFLKGIPFLDWIEDFDPVRSAMVMIGKRRAESEDRKDIPEFIFNSEYHGGRTLWHPLYMHTKTERNVILNKYGVEILSHRSDECHPCVNANRPDFLRLTPGEIERVNDLEVEIARPMFRPKRFGAMGIHGVVAWAKDGRKRGSIEDEEHACAGFFGCGL